MSSLFNSRRGRSRSTRASSQSRAAVLATALLVAFTGVATPTPAGAVNADHGDRVVSDDPVNVTPHVMNGAVMSITQVGDKMIAAGTFTSVSPADSYDDTSDDLVRNRIFAFDADTGAIDTSFNPDLGGAAKSLDTDGTHIYVGGSFGSVGGDSSIKRVVKLTADGDVVGSFDAVPNSGVNEVVVRGSRLFVGGSFTSIRAGGSNTPRSRLAVLDANTGAVSPSLNVPFEGVYNGGNTLIKRFDVSPDGSRLVAVGNFATVGGQPRVQIAMLDTSGPSATVASWATNRFDRAHNNCARVFDTFMRDIDFAPDGSWFAVTTTGAFAGGASSGTLCDTITRWETDSTANDPTWADYVGGDTTYGVAVTGSAVYVGGHQRWQNNPFQGDQAGPGAVPRSGIAALDPVNGLPLSWNPGRTRGVGAQAMFATPQGLWVGSDTIRIGGERRARVAFLPLAGGTTTPTVPAAQLPGDLYLAQDDLLRRPVDATGAPTGAAATANADIDWSALRGGFLVNGTLYYGLADGGLYQRSFDPSTGAVGSQQTVDLYDDPDTGQRIPFAIANLTGTFYDDRTHRLYYTVLNDNRLFYRHFTPESSVVGAQTFVADSGGVSFGSVAGMTLASDRILYGSSVDGALRSVPFADGRVTGGPTTLSTDGSWRYRTIFAGEGSAPQNEPPTAMAAGSCDGLTCEFTGSGSDPEGGPVTFSWDFGDGTSGSGPATSHTYDTPGDYVVTLTVTDDAGATATSTVVVEAVQENRAPVATFAFDCGDLTCSFDSSGTQDPDGDDLELAWAFGDGATGTGAVTEHAYQTPGTYDVTLTVTDPSGAADTVTRSVEVDETQAAAIAPVGATSVNRNSLNFPLTVPGAAKGGDTMILFLSENRSGTEVTGPGAGWNQLGAPVVDGTSKTTAWYRVAQAADAGDQVVLSTDVRTKAAATLLVYRGADPVTPLGAWAGAAKQGNSASHETPVVTNAHEGAWRVSYWSVKSSSITSLTGPAQEVVRDSTTGGGGGRIGTLVTDAGEPVGAGPQGGLVAQSDDATGMASTWTLMLRPDQAG